jgi:cytochrome d ubiquinol oxidase subunit I
VLAVSAYYLLRGRHTALAKRSMTVAASFGLASALSVVVLGDESGYTAGQNQKMKIAAIEAMWETEPAPASFTVVGWPDVGARKTEFAVRVPWVLGLIATRSADTPVPGIADLVTLAAARIRSGMIAYDSLAKLRNDRANTALRKTLDAHVTDLGYGLLLKRYRPDVQNATQAQIAAAAESTIPNVPVLFWAFRFMVAFGFWFIALFAAAFYLSAKRELQTYRTFLWAALLTLPLPWVAAELGWIVAEYGRQPWAIEGVLPTFLAVSSTGAGNVLFSLIGFAVFYSTLLGVDLFLLVKYIRLGPDETLGHIVALAGAREEVSHAGL